MKSAFLTGFFVYLGVAVVNAQPPTFDPTQLDTPSQFYTNGARVDAWNRDEDQQQQVTFWFGKSPKNSLTYRQLIAIRRDAEPDKIYYFDIVGRKFVGRYDMDQMKYSLLDHQHRLENLEDIRPEWFPPPGDKPSISELFDPDNQGPPNDEQLSMPPVTMEFPRLQKSEWNGFYVDLGNRRRKMTLEFDGQTGNYQDADGNVAGKFSHVRYEMDMNTHLIRGNWSVGNTRGGFEFRIMMMDLNSFQGEYWVGNDRGRLQLWDGKRTSRQRVMSNQNQRDKEASRIAGIVVLTILAVTGTGLAVASLVTSRIPLLLAFVPIGEINRQDNAVWFWIFVVVFLTVGIAGSAGLVLLRKQAARQK